MKDEATTMDEVGKAKEEKAALLLLLWSEDLRDISLKSVLLPNEGDPEEGYTSSVVVVGEVTVRSREVSDKPHDVEFRAAPTLFHRYDNVGVHWR